MSTTTAKKAEVLFGDTIDTFESQDLMLPLVDFEQPDGSEMQNTSNVVIRTVRQQRPSLTGWDLTGEEQGIIKQAYLATLGTPRGDLIQARADDLRNGRFWDEAGKESGEKQASVLNTAIATAIAKEGSLFYRSNATSGYSFIGEANVMRKERQLRNQQCYFLLNDRDSFTFSEDLAARQTLQGKPNEVWGVGKLAGNVAQQDVYEGSFLPNLVGGADPATTVTGNQSFAPLAGTVTTGADGSGVVTNNDYRYATMPVADSSSYNVGDKFTLSNTGVTVKALGKDDKSDTGQAMIFTVNAAPDATSIMFSPRPIAADDTTLTKVQLAYANIDTVILNGATVNRLNTDASNRTNLFWEKSSVEVLGGTIPVNLMSEYDGMKHMTSTLKNGLQIYMFYDGNLATMNFRYRIFVWYNVVVKDPANCGVALTY